MITKFHSTNRNKNVSPRTNQALRVHRPSSREILRTSQLTGQQLLHYLADLEAVEVEKFRFRNSRVKGELLRLPAEARVEVQILREELQTIERVSRILVLPKWRFLKAQGAPEKFPATRCIVQVKRTWEGGEDTCSIVLPRKLAGKWHCEKQGSLLLVSPASRPTQERYKLEPDED